MCDKKLKKYFGSRYVRLALFWLLAVSFAVTMHTLLLVNRNEDADFYLLSVCARMTVPFFFMVTVPLAAALLLFRDTSAGRQGTSNKEGLLAKKVWSMQGFDHLWNSLKGKKKPKVRTAACARAWIELDSKALKQNIAFLRSSLPKSCKLMPALKADAYGHGAALIAKELQKLGIDAYCVASAKEGVTLRRQGTKGEILILGYTNPQEFALLHRYHLTQTVVDAAYAAQLNQFGKKIHVHIGIDTGMHRIGERYENTEKLAKMFEMQHLVIDGLFTHLCVSDSNEPQDQSYTKKQAQAFSQTIQKLQERGYSCPKVHMLASYGVLNYPQYAGDYARVGIALYGVLSTKEDTMGVKQHLKPVLSLKARVAAVKVLYAGESVGYGLTYTADCDKKLAVLSIGYADGLPRALSEGVGSVLINGQTAPVIGRICMDQTIVDVSGIKHVEAGDVAVLIGKSGGLEISACDLAKQAGTITNEVLSRMGQRLERILV